MTYILGSSFESIIDELRAASEKELRQAKQLASGTPKAEPKSITPAAPAAAKAAAPATPKPTPQVKKAAPPADPTVNKPIDAPAKVSPPVHQIPTPEEVIKRTEAPMNPQSVAVIGSGASRIAGSGLSYWDPTEASQPLPGQPDLDRFEMVAEDEQGVPIVRYLVTAVLLSMGFILLAFAGWGLGITAGMVDLSKYANPDAMKMTGLIMLIFGTLLGVLMVASSVYVMFFYNPKRRKKKASR